MICPTAKSVGRRVIYHPHHDAPKETGTVTSVTTAFVFVRYDDQPEWAPGKATSPEDLTWLLTPRRIR